MGQVIASFERVRLTALVRWLVKMEVVCSRRVNFDFVQEFPIRQPFVKDSLSCGTSANVAHADKKNSVFKVDHFFKLLAITF
jgi:hypothetical protein